MANSGQLLEICDLPNRRTVLYIYLMEQNEASLHLEQQIRKLKKHVTEQDQEIFKLSKRVDALVTHLRRLEKRLQEGVDDSPIDADADPLDERPPHY